MTVYTFKKQIKSLYCPKERGSFVTSAAFAISLLTSHSHAVAQTITHSVTDATFRRAIEGIKLGEPLVSTADSSINEDAALAQALADYSSQTNKEDLSVFNNFLRVHPRSGWRVSLLANEGLLNYHFGYFSRALVTWQAAWDEGHFYTDLKIKALVDRVAGEELRMHARLGHAQAISVLLAEIGSRQLTGPATEEMDGARQGLWMMHNNPGVAYLCGPTALKSLLSAEGRSPQQMRFLDDVRSGPHGVSLAEVADLASKAGLDYRLVYREIGQSIPVPAIIHWKLSHFAAITEIRDARFHIVDPTFGRDLWMSSDAIDAEGSGYFLVPANIISSTQLKAVSQAQAAAIRGM